MMLTPFHQHLSILSYAMNATAGLSPAEGIELRRLREAIYDFATPCDFSQASISEERNHIHERWQKVSWAVRMDNEL
jgi:hypothetical protein